MLFRMPDDYMNKTRLAALLIAAGLAAGSLARGEALLIGYTNCLTVTNYSQPLMNDIAQLKWYFSHASVGGNMMDGLAALRAANTNLYRIRTLADDGVPPPAAETGVVYEYMRGNPGWQVKCDTFGTYVNNGWRFPRVNVAVNKLCYIDQDANLSYYLTSMTNLEAAYPQTLFVYMTIPLQTYLDNNNYLRNVFNDGLRAWCQTNNRVLFDVADIEAHDPSGALVSFSYNSRVCQRMYDGYSTDGGHLNGTGSQLVARGFYALAAALLTVDRDGDGQSDAHELMAGTAPSDKQSVFQITAATRPAAGRLSLQWNSASNRLYSVQRSANLLDPAGFTNLALDVPATPPLNTFTDTPPATGSFFYRVQVRQ